MFGKMTDDSCRINTDDVSRQIYRRKQEFLSGQKNYLF
jgi:hypothetical protein